MKTQKADHLQVKECLRPSETGREAWNRFLLPSEGRNPTDTLIIDSQPQEPSKKFLLSHEAVVAPRTNMHIINIKEKLKLKLLKENMGQSLCYLHWGIC